VGGPATAAAAAAAAAAHSPALLCLALALALPTLQVAEWLLEQALVHQRRTLHAGTPGDNVTVVVVRLRPLPPVPRSTGSRLNLRAGGSGELVSPKLADVSLPCLPAAIVCCCVSLA
jgi:hypothetical protein